MRRMELSGEHALSCSKKLIAILLQQAVPQSFALSDALNSLLLPRHQYLKFLKREDLNSSAAGYIET